MDIKSQLLPKRIGRADYERASHFIAVAKGLEPADIVDPDFWQHVADKLRVNDRIEVLGPDFDMDLRVVAIDPRKMWAQVRVLRLCEAAGITVAGVEQPAEAAIVAGAADAEGYTVEWGGRHLWRIVRGADLIEKGFANKPQADARLAEIKAGVNPRVAA